MGKPDPPDYDLPSPGCWLWFIAQSNFTGGFSCSNVFCVIGEMLISLSFGPLQGSGPFRLVLSSYFPACSSSPFICGNLQVCRWLADGCKERDYFSQMQPFR